MCYYNNGSAKGHMLTLDRARFQKLHVPKLNKIIYHLFILLTYSCRFLLARLHLDLLATKTTVRNVKRAMSLLPKEVTDSYDEVMRRIQGQGPDELKLARKTLYWIIKAAMPLTLPALQHALAVEPEDSLLDHDSIPSEDLLISVCARMVVMRPDSRLVELVHYTAQEYLDRKAREYFPEAHEDMLRTCITYLSFRDLATGHVIQIKS